MGILLLRVIDLNATVHMISGDIDLLLFKQIQKHSLPNRSQVTRDDFIIILRPSAEILQVLFNGGCRGRRHARSHVHAVLQAEIHDFPRCHSRDGCSGPFPSVRSLCEQEGPAPGYGPGSGQGTLVSIAERVAEFLFRAGKMTGSHAGCPFRKSSGDDE